jgi:carbamate kinase
MTTGWNYSDLVHAARLSGGPEKYVNKLICFGLKEGVKRGHIEMIPLVIIAGALGSGVTYLNCKVYQALKKKERLSEMRSEISSIVAKVVVDEKDEGVNSYGI